MVEVTCCVKCQAHHSGSSHVSYSRPGTRDIKEWSLSEGATLGSVEVPCLTR